MYLLNLISTLRHKNHVFILLTQFEEFEKLVGHFRIMGPLKLTVHGLCTLNCAIFFFFSSFFLLFFSSLFLPEDTRKLLVVQELSVKACKSPGRTAGLPTGSQTCSPVFRNSERLLVSLFARRKIFTVFAPVNLCV